MHVLRRGQEGQAGRSGRVRELVRELAVGAAARVVAPGAFGDCGGRTVTMHREAAAFGGGAWLV